MSKRAADGQGGEDRYGSGLGGAGGAADDKPKMATAAQLAKRRIKEARTRRPDGASRSQSPAIFSNPFSPQSHPTNNQSSSGFSTSFTQPPNGVNGVSLGFPQASFGGFGQTTSDQQQPSNGVNGSAPSTSFTFGATPAAKPNGVNPVTPPVSFQFGPSATTSSFTFGQTKSQQPSTQSGFNPSTTPAFGQGQNRATPDYSFASFGQPQPPQETPKPANTGFGGSLGLQDGQQEASGGLFKFGATARGIGEKKPEDQGSKSANLFSGFGQQATNGHTPPPQPSGDTQKTPSTLFRGNSGQSQPHADKPTETLKPFFGGLGQTTPQNGEKTPATDALQAPEQSQNNAWSAFTKTAPSEQPPSRPGSGFNPSTSSIFGQPPPQTNGDKPAEGQKPLFGSFGQAPQQNGDKTSSSGSRSSSVFGDVAPSNKPFASNMFTEAVKDNPLTEDDTSMISPESTPHKPVFATSVQQPSQTPTWTPSGPSQPNEKGSDTPKAHPPSDLFSRFTKDTPSQFTQKETPMAPSNPLFDPSRTTRDTPQMEETPKNPFGASTIGTSHPSFFQLPVSKEPEAPATVQKAPSNSSMSGSPAPNAATQQPVFTAPQPAAPAAAPASVARTSMESTLAVHIDQFKELNGALREHLKHQNAGLDWTSICEYYVKEAARIQDKTAPQLPRISVSAPAPHSAPLSGGASGNTLHAPSQPSALPSNVLGSKVPSQQPGSGPSSSTQNMFASQVFQSSAPSNMFDSAPQPSSSTTVFSAGTPKPSSSSNVFAAQTPRPAPSGNPFGASMPKSPATQPSKKRPIQHEDDDDDDNDQTPRPGGQANGKRQVLDEAVMYPKLPHNASETAKLFASTLDKPADRPAPQGASVLGKSGASRQNGEALTPEGLKPSISLTSSQDSTNAQPPTFSRGSKPSTTVAPASSGFKPSGIPTFTPPAGGFLSAFGAAAKKQEEEEKKKRKAEDYDSDEENEADWERKYEEEQRQKKAKIEEVAKSGLGFRLTDSAAEGSSTAGVFKLGSTGGTSGTTATAPTPMQASQRSVETSNAHPAQGIGGSLFDRISKAGDEAPSTSASSIFKPQGSTLAPTNICSPTPQNPSFGGSGTSILFAHLNTPKPSTFDVSSTPKNDAEKQQPAGDNTWTQGSALKFGIKADAPAPTPLKFGGLFGSSAPAEGVSSPGLLKPLSATGFQFGKPPGLTTSMSRATTLGTGTDGGATTDGEASKAGGDESKAASDDDGEQPQEQVEDKTALTQQDREEWDVLFEVAKCKVKKLETKDDNFAWVDKGLGPFWILKNKATGKTRALLKVPPFGKPAMNFGVLQGGDSMYRHEGMKGKGVMGTFVDHMAKEEEDRTKLSSWAIVVGKEEDAKEIVRILREQQPQ